MGGRAGVQVLPYLDDFLFIFCSKEQAGAGAVWIKTVLDSLGLATNPKKCEWEPSQSVHHLGITVNTAARVIVLIYTGTAVIINYINIKGKK